ncbi:hypothetical protein L1D14_10705 [Vibrio tubiashii]|uniref:hypothetical protein n=1 Tax=Vibrio tubiashii TaxID=29498 RepID=UPI001EFEACC2|nr:hypothetical protein [Vibrio tubiashii]MCG9576708.1 hypothetical protein [Vibrio tubiashii]
MDIQKTKQLITKASSLLFTLGLSLHAKASLKAPAAPKIDGLTQGETNWIKIFQVFGENVLLAGSLLVVGAISLACLIGILVAAYKEFVSKEGGSGKILTTSCAVGAVSITISAYLVNDLMAMLGQ